MSEVWVSAVYTEPKKKEKRVNILPDGSPAEYFVSEADEWFRDSKVMVQSYGGEFLLSVDDCHTGDEGELVDDHAQTTLTVHQARELAYWLLATTAKKAMHG